MVLAKMRFIFLFSTLLCLFTILVRADLESEYKREEIIPDVLDQPPKNLLKISFDGVDVPYGGIMTPTAVKKYPEIQWNFDASCLFTLVMTDPDAPSRKEPQMREFLHWVMYNIPGDDLMKGQLRAEYMGAGPPKDTGLHRYIISVHEQTEKLTFDMEPLSARSINGRVNFSLRKFINDNKLVAQPIAGTMFLAEYDDYVDEFYRNVT